MLSRLSALFFLAYLFVPSFAPAQEPTDIDAESTHRQTRMIEIQQGSKDTLKINAFCLNADGEILAAVGDGPGEIRVFNDQGDLLRSWEIAVKPEAIGVTPKGTVLAGGEGKLFHFSSVGETLVAVDAPHADSLRENTAALRKEAIEYLSRSTNMNSTASLEARIESYERIIGQLEEKEDRSQQEESLLNALPRTLQIWQEQLAQQMEAEKDEPADETQDKGPSEKAIATQIESMTKSKMRVASISSDGKSVFVATRALTGYGFAVWKMNEDMSQGQEIVTGLSGCCGQMDVQACKNGLFVAENSRKRVVCYDANGEEIRKWGKADRTGMDGFTSCCNPMNVCFNAVGDVFTAESNTGRIKRFSAQGEFLDFVGDVKLVPGCKNVSIAVTPDHSRVYMLDITRNHIVVMEKKPAELDDSSVITASATEEAK